jgi:hypothetical protein
MNRDEEHLGSILPSLNLQSKSAPGVLGIPINIEFALREFGDG